MCTPQQILDVLTRGGCVQKRKSAKSSKAVSPVLRLVAPGPVEHVPCCAPVLEDAVEYCEASEKYSGTVPVGMVGWAAQILPSLGPNQQAQLGARPP